MQQFAANLRRSEESSLQASLQPDSTSEAAQVDLRNVDFRKPEKRKRKQPELEHEAHKAAQTGLHSPMAKKAKKQLSNKSDSGDEARHPRKSSSVARPQPNKSPQTEYYPANLRRVL